MSLLEDSTVAFIVRVWFEQAESSDGPQYRRGVIEHLPTGKRRYFVDLNDITRFIETCLSDKGLESDQDNWLRGSSLGHR